MYKLIQPMSDECCSYDEFENGINTIKYENFHALLDICFHSASCFSLSKAPWTICTEVELAKELEPFLVKKVRIQKWFCYDFSSNDQFMEINIYKANPSTQIILQKYFYDIFLRDQKNGCLVDSTQTLEDLCIFTETSLLLGTVSHEYMCHVYPPNETVAQEIVLTGRWKYSADIPSEQINIEQII